MLDRLSAYGVRNSLFVVDASKLPLPRARSMTMTMPCGHERVELADHGWQALVRVARRIPHPNHQNLDRAEQRNRAWLVPRTFV